jgi:hypothetical protein
MRKRALIQPEVLGQRVGMVPQVHIVRVFKFRKQTFDCTECALAIMAPLVFIAELVGPVRGWMLLVSVIPFSAKPASLRAFGAHHFAVTRVSALLTFGNISNSSRELYGIDIVFTGSSLKDLLISEPL